MKKIVLLIGIFLFYVGIIYAQTTDAQIRQAATILEVPFDDLKQFVQSYQTRNSSGSNQISIEDPLDIPFLYNNPRIEIGNTYEITADVWFNMVMGTNLFIGFDTRSVGQGMAIEIKSRIEDFQRGDPIRVVFLYTPTRFASEPSFMNSVLVSVQRR